MNEHTCPICGIPLQFIPRYPHYVCEECAGRTVSPDGRPVIFFNLSLSGGYGARYLDTEEPYTSHDCMIDGVLCYADEARFGGIVIQVVDSTSHQ